MKSFLCATALLLALALPAQALDLANMTDDERALFRDEVRAYLIENPEVISEALAVLQDRQAQDEQQKDVAFVKDNAATLFQSKADWVGGNKDGDIVVVEFMDYRCSYCRKAHAEVAELIKSDGNIRYIVKEFPILGEDSVQASRFAIAVRQIGGGDAYLAAHNTLMTMRADITPEVLDRVAIDLGLDATLIRKTMTSSEVDAVIAANHKLAADMQINGTPTFVVQNTMLRGYVPLTGMREIVASERKG